MATGMVITRVSSSAKKCAIAHAHAHSPCFHSKALQICFKDQSEGLKRERDSLAVFEEWSHCAGRETIHGYSIRNILLV